MGWTVVVCPAPGRSTRRFRLGPASLTILLLLALGFVGLSSAVGWAVGEHQARQTLAGEER